MSNELKVLLPISFFSFVLKLSLPILPSPLSIEVNIFFLLIQFTVLISKIDLNDTILTENKIETVKIEVTRNDKQQSG